MGVDYNRAERYGLRYEDYLREYNRRYPWPQVGPTHSSDCGGVGGKECGCWVCRSLEWGCYRKNEPVEEVHDYTVFKTVAKILIIIWVLTHINNCLNDECFKGNDEMYRPTDSNEKHWLYK